MCYDLLSCMHVGFQRPGGREGGAKIEEGMAKAVPRQVTDSAAGLVYRIICETLTIIAHSAKQRPPRG